MKRSLTLTELLIAVSLLAVIMLGASSFDIASRELLKSSERKTQVLNELMLVLDHIHKHVVYGKGTVDDPALKLMGFSGGALSGGQALYIYDEDYPNTAPTSIPRYSYSFDTLAHQIIFRDNKNNINQTLTKRFIDAGGIANPYGGAALAPFKLTVSCTPTFCDGGVKIDNLTFVYDPSNINYDVRDNPIVSISDVYYFPSAQTLN